MSIVLGIFFWWLFGALYFARHGGEWHALGNTTVPLWQRLYDTVVLLPFLLTLALYLGLWLLGDWW